MKDLVSLIVENASTPSNEPQLVQQVRSHVAALLASAGLADRQIVRQAEEVVRTAPSRSFTFDTTGNATLTHGRQTWNAGRFEPISIGELKHLAITRRNQSVRPGTYALRLWVLDGASPCTDIGALQATSANAVFQVASQFNCLESPGPHVTAVMNYFDDYTQGPRASISAFPATLLRHYSAPAVDGSRFVQHTNGDQIDLLAKACPRAVRNGYFTGKGITNPEVLVANLEKHFDHIRVGVHSEVEVALGYNWDGAIDQIPEPRITQVFTSTIAGGGYDGRINLGEAAFNNAARQLLRAAYLGTLLTAIRNDCKRVILTLIGGGVFQNPISMILESIDWAIAESTPYLHQDIEVILNGYNLGRLLSLDEILPGVRNYGGVIVQLNEQGIVRIMR